jgi:NADPH:quinone reductase
MTSQQMLRTRAIAVRGGDTQGHDQLVEVDSEVGELRPHDLLVDVRAVSVNPVDEKVRASYAGSTPKVLGYDAAGVVTAIGSAVDSFAVGDSVYYAGAIDRPGTNAMLHRVDERIVGRKPASLGFAAAAAMPLTTITAWEALFDKFRLSRESSGTLLVYGGAGGVGSMAIQLARQLTDVEVIATASRPESARWVESLGAHHVVPPRAIVNDVRTLVPDGVDWILSSFSGGNEQAFADALKVRGEVVAIDDAADLDISVFKSRSQTWHWEFMFARPLHEPDSTGQRDLLNAVADLVDAGVVRSTMSTELSPINVSTLEEAHRLVRTSSTIGKVVVSRGDD